MKRYHLAYSASPHAVALVAEDESTEQVVGVLLGALDVRAHYSLMVRRHAVSLALPALARTAVDPALARDLVLTRACRYARGALRALVPEESSQHSSAPKLRTGLLAHLMVAGSTWRRGIGAALVAEFETEAWVRGLDRLELVTLPEEQGAGGFYERVGWCYEDRIISRSGERFSRYARYLNTTPEG